MSKAPYIIAGGVAGIGALGWYFYRSRERAQLVEMLKAVPEYKGDAENDAAVLITYFNLTSAEEGLRLLTGRTPGMLDALVPYLSPEQQEAVKRGREVYQQGKEAYSKGERTVRSGANVAEQAVETSTASKLYSWLTG